MALPASLPGLSTREAITDMVHRMINAFDLTDVSMLESALTEDVKIQLAGMNLDGYKAVKEGVWDRVSKLDTTHSVSNIRINVKEGDTKASLTATAVAYHFRPGTGRDPGAPRFVAGSLYSIDCVKEKDGLWKAKDWNLKIVWTEGDQTVME